MALVGTNLPSQKASFNFQGTKYLAHTTVTITVTNQGKSRQADDLICHDGVVSFGAHHKRDVKSCVLCFNSRDLVAADKLFTDLTLMASPYIVTPIAYARGVGDFAGHTFLAVPQFSCTLAPYLLAKSKNTIDKQRFTEEFIRIIRDVINGILTLHSQGFCCCYLKACHILIFTVGALKTGQIWNFSRTEIEAVKLKDWERLGQIIQNAAKAQLSTIEIDDIWRRLMNGSLKGLQALKHSALLTEQEKFENILALNFYIEVHKKDQFQSASADQQAVDKLKSFIAAIQYWKTKIPQWIAMTPGYIDRSNETGGGFVLWLRDRVEHASAYVPQKVSLPSPQQTQKLGINPDL